MVKNLRKLRKEKGISQQQLADVIGTSQQSINKYENHPVEPDIGTLIKLSDYFQTTVDDLVGHIVPPETERSVLARSREEQRLLQSYQKLDREEKDSIQLVIGNYLKNKNP